MGRKSLKTRGRDGSTTIMHINQKDGNTGQSPQKYLDNPCCHILHCAIVCAYAYTYNLYTHQNAFVIAILLVQLAL